MGQRNRILRLLPLLVLAVLACTGCSGPSDLPRDRQGRLPFPGLFTFYSVADPQKLGEHRYEREARHSQPDETESGIFYTTEAGFLDLAHLRLAIDWTRYSMLHIRRAMDENRTELDLMGSNGARFYLTLNYPDDWDVLPRDEREELEDELALRSAEQLSYLILTWHEMVTWFGYTTIPLLSEKRSAFTYDDVMSHVIGIRVADQALRDPTRPYDEAVTFALNAELQSIGAVSPKQTAIAASKVRGVWYSGEQPLKRQMDIGLTDGIVYPWLVQGLPFAPDTPPRAFQLPSMNDVCGRDVNGFCSVEIDPRIAVGDEMRKYLPNRPQRFSADHDVPILMGVVRDQMRQEFDPAFDQPWHSDPKLLSHQ